MVQYDLDPVKILVTTEITIMNFAGCAVFIVSESSSKLLPISKFIVFFKSFFEKFATI